MTIAFRDTEDAKKFLDRSAFGPCSVLVGVSEYGVRRFTFWLTTIGWAGLTPPGNFNPELDSGEYWRR